MTLRLPTSSKDECFSQILLFADVIGLRIASAPLRRNRPSQRDAGIRGKTAHGEVHFDPAKIGPAVLRQRTRLGEYCLLLIERVTHVLCRRHGYGAASGATAPATPADKSAVSAIVTTNQRVRGRNLGNRIKLVSPLASTVNAKQWESVAHDLRIFCRAINGNKAWFLRRLILVRRNLA